MRGACRRSTTWFRCRWICGRRSTRTCGWNRGWRGCSAALEFSRAGLRKATRPRLAQIVERREDLLPALPVVLGLVVGQSGMSQPDFGTAALGLHFYAYDALEPVSSLGHPGLLEEPRALQSGEPSVMGPPLALPFHFGMPEAVDPRVHDQAGGLEPVLHVCGIGPRAEYALRCGLQLAGGGDGLGHVSSPLPGMRLAHPDSRSRTARTARSTGRSPGAAPPAARGGARGRHGAAAGGLPVPAPSGAWRRRSAKWETAPLHR